MTIHNNYINHCSNKCSSVNNLAQCTTVPSPVKQSEPDRLANESQSCDLNTSDTIVCNAIVVDDTASDMLQSKKIDTKSSPSLDNRHDSNHITPTHHEQYALTSTSSSPEPVAYEILAESTNNDAQKADSQSESSDSVIVNVFYYQEPSSVIERESTAPCVSPEPSQTSANEDKEHYRPQHSFPFIDADSISSLVGHDDLRRLRSVKRPDMSSVKEKLHKENIEKSLNEANEKVELESEKIKRIELGNDVNGNHAQEAVAEQPEEEREVKF
ncbi:hypothetical protein DICVIV_10491 [Dictyocaulus viviparus]|uniref:Uncharacterized protein n=1 Tax=Dictyocaulus viviparus TaxID=29172 RepID=A0A0D8XFN4_DICVI|nr:hypothetical protein DICVIV_10491 [Dictyocaulus viviparus]